MRVGVLGGTFDPIHVGHLIVAEKARACLKLETVVFIPAGRPYFKADWKVTDARHRLEMVTLAIEANPGFEVSEIEIGRPGPTYTVDTLVELREEMGQNIELYLVMGLDSLAELGRWRQPKRVLDICTVVGYPRSGSLEVNTRQLDGIRPGASSKVITLDGPLIDVSGSDIRRRVARGQSIRDLVPEKVEVYIHEQGLYGTRRGDDREPAVK